MNENDDNQPLTREAYRKQQLSSKQELLERDKKRVQVEREYARSHGNNNDWATNNEEKNYKTDKWKKTNTKLNITLAIIVALIVVAYLVLFFIN